MRFALSGFGLGLTDSGVVADLHDLLADIDRSVLQVNVLPAQPAHLAASQPQCAATRNRANRQCRAARCKNTAVCSAASAVFGVFAAVQTARAERTRPPAQRSSPSSGSRLSLVAIALAQGALAGPGGEVREVSDRRWRTRRGRKGQERPEVRCRRLRLGGQPNALRTLWMPIMSSTQIMPLVRTRG
jgi:hypothetical protein